MLRNVLKLQHKPRKGISELPPKSIICNSGGVNKMGTVKCVFFSQCALFPWPSPSGLCSCAISCLRESEGCWIYINPTLWHDDKTYAEHENTHTQECIKFIPTFQKTLLLLRLCIYRETTPVWQRMWGGQWFSERRGADTELKVWAVHIKF